MKVLFLQGLPGSGKSTWAKQFCENNLDWIRVSRDDLRYMRGKYWIPKEEDLITRWETELIKSALTYKKNVVIDATNFNKVHVNRMKSELNYFCQNQELSVEFETKVFETSVEECIERDLKRPNSVGEKVIKRMYLAYLKKYDKIKQDVNLQKAIICDLDGTVAIHVDRGPFDYDKCDTDIVNNSVANIVLNYYKQNEEIFKEENYYKVIFLSGREDLCKEKTEQWLKTKLGINDFELYMRKSGDYRKDAIIKREIFEEYIKDKYYIEFILDDRQQVVDMWRDLGLTCLQVAEGDF